jgi:cyclopropane fatty-acyl-phospholipid synthase-like methyltransferase
MKYLKITDSLTMVDENHLGGFIIENDPATFTPNLWEYICKTYNIESVIDVGCGMGYGIQEFSKYAKDVSGIDGSEYVQNNSPYANKIKKIDFTKEKYIPNKNYDLAWSCEFVEHVEEQYIKNYFGIFKNSKYCAITYADVDQQGHHHVNCKTKNYWIDMFISNNFEYMEKDLKELKEQAYKDALKYNFIFKDNHFYNRGLFFKNNNIK